MKFITRHIKHLLLLAFFTSPIFLTQQASAVVNIPDSFAQNGIVFYYCDQTANPSSGGGYISSICGSTPKEKYWSALRMHLDEIHAAAVMGNSLHEGSFGVTRWEYGPMGYATAIVNRDGGSFWPHKNWERLYNSCNGGSGSVCGGVGSFGITWSLSSYLQYINSKDPSLIKYFRTPESYSWAGDKALAAIGEADYDKLVELEVTYVLNEANSAAFKQTSTLAEATDWWTTQYERCKTCQSESTKQARRASAQKVYDEMAGFTCSGSSSPMPSSVSSVSYPLSGPTCSGGSGFTWYGQGDPRWGDEPYGNYEGATSIANSACGPSSFALIAGALLNRDITPLEATKIAGDAGMHIPGNGSSQEVTKVLADHYGLEFTTIPVSSNQDAVDKISQYLRDGWMIHVSGGDGRNPFGSGDGHYIGIRGITADGKWLIADSQGGPGGLGQTNSFKEWEPMDLVTAGMHTGFIKAVRAPGSLPACNNPTYSGISSNACPSSGENSSSNTPGNREGWVTESDNPIINAYLHDSLSSFSSPTPKSGDRHHNCSAFSLWFIINYTNLAHPGSTVNGNATVSTIYSYNRASHPDLTISSTPSVYSLASWSTRMPNTSSGNHTGVVVGIDASQDAIYIAEAGWNNPGFTGVHRYSLSQFSGGSGKYYLNLNNHLKSSSDLP